MMKDTCIFDLSIDMYINLDPEIIELNEDLVDEEFNRLRKTLTQLFDSIPGLQGADVDTSNCSTFVTQDSNGSVVKSNYPENFISVICEYSGEKTINDLVAEVNAHLRTIPSRRYSSILYDGTSTPYSYSDYWDTGIGSEARQSKLDVSISYDSDVVKAFSSKGIFGPVSEEAAEFITKNIDIIEAMDVAGIKRELSKHFWDLELEVLGILYKAGVDVHD